MDHRRVSTIEPDVVEVVSARMSAMNATIEDLEDSLVLLRQALRDSGSHGLSTGQQVGATPLPVISTRGSTEKHGKRSKKAKAKSMIEIPGAGLRRRHASSPDLMNPVSPEAQQPDVGIVASTSQKHKSKFRPPHKSRSRHGKGASVSEDEVGTIKAGRSREPTERLTVERKEMPRMHSGSGAKNLFETIFHRRPSHHRNRASTVTTATVNSIPETVPPPVPSLPSIATSRPSTSTITPTPRLSVDALLDEMTTKVEDMRHQHSSLLTLLPLSNFHNVLSSAEESSTPYESDTTEGPVSPKEMTRPSAYDRSAIETDSPAGSAFQTAMSRQTGHRSRASLSSLYAEVASIYYDAEIEPYDDEDAMDRHQATVGRAGSRASFASFEVDRHVERAMQDLEERDYRGPVTDEVPRGVSAHHSEEAAESPQTPTMHNSASLAAAPAVSGPINRRTSLPAPSPASEPSLIGMLRKNVGKDLSTITFDVTFNEPLSLLQKLAEEVEYTNLLRLATQAVDPIERLAHIAAFAVSQYANSKHRTSRKPFNPLQGESFELVRIDLGLKFISEKVTHHPPRMACYAEGPGWVYTCTSSAKNKLSGMSLEIQPLGTQHIVLNGNERYSWTKPKSYMRNLVAGAKYLETIGDLTIRNESTGEKAVINFEAGGWAGKRNQVSGICYTASGSKAAWIDGVWDSKLNVRYGSSHDPSHPLWLANPWPANTDKNYGFTEWAIQLNETTPDLVGVVPPSDSRLRPDQRAYEEGRIDEADHLKTALEEAQRQRKQADGDYVKPRWFKPLPHGSGEDEWEYTGGYFESRADGSLPQKAMGGLFDL